MNSGAIRNKLKLIHLVLFLLVSINSFTQIRDTLRLTITKIDKKPADTVFVYSSRVDTIALQPVKTDTSKIVKDENKQDIFASRYKIDIMGRVRVNGYYDFEGMTSTEGFLPYDIPVGEEEIKGLSSVYLGARQSRLGINGSANTKVGTINTYIEVDFASSTSSFWRLRHAYAEWNFFKLGYTWSTFMDNASLPNTVDFEGPNSALVKRHGLIRYERILRQKSIIGISLEAPSSDYFNPADSLIKNKNKQGNFDLAARYKYFGSWGHVQLAGIFRRINYLEYNKLNVLYGWGILISSDIVINRKNQLYAQFSAGEGIANYYVGFSERMLDAVYNPVSGKMELKTLQGSFISYTYLINKKWKFSATAGQSYLWNKGFESGNSFKSSKYLAINVFFDPIETISLGFELTDGARTNKNNQTGRADRISFCANFDF